MLKKLALAGLLLTCASNTFAGALGDYSMMWASQIRGEPSRPAVAMSARGDIVAAWAELGADGSMDVFIRRTLTSEIPVPATETAAGDQIKPKIASGADGRTMLTWESAGKIYGRLFDAQLQPSSADFEIGAGGSSPAVAADASGNFVVVWQRTSNVSPRIMGRLYLADGTPLGDAFPVSKPVNGIAHLNIARAVRGEFVVVWEASTDNGADIFMRVFSADGAPQGPEAPVAAEVGYQRRSPAVAMDAHGGIAIAWNAADPSGAAAIKLRRFIAGGVPAGGESMISDAVDATSQPSVAADASGDVAVSWNGPASAGEYRGASLRIFSRDGIPYHDGIGLGFSGPFSGPAPDAIAPSIAMDADGDVGVVSMHTTSNFWGSDYPRTFVNTRRITGPERIDTAIAVADSPDPVLMGGTIRYTVTLRNLHGSSVETGIAEVDSAVGLAPIPVHFHGISPVAYPDFCVVPSYSVSLRCDATVPAGSEKSFAVDIQAPRHATLLQSDVWAMSGQNDPVLDNDHVTVTTRVVCDYSSEAGTFRIVNAPQSVREDASAAIQIERSGGSCGAVSVSYSVSGPSFDVPGSSGMLTWAAGQQGIQAVTVVPTQDNVDEDPGRAAVRLSNPQGGAAIAGPAEVSLAVVDDDAEPTVAITPGSATLTEGPWGASVSFQVSLSHPSRRNPVVRLTLGGNATPATDFNISPGLELTFSAIQTQRPVTVSVINDAAFEGDESMVLSLGEIERAIASTSQPTGVLTIKDDDKPKVFISSPNQSVSEGWNGVLSVRLADAVTLPVTVVVQWSGTAGRGSDFSAPTSVTIPAGSLSADVEIPALTDGLDEEDTEQAVATLGSATNGDVDPSRATMTLGIIDIDAMPSIQFIDRQATVVEDGPVVVNLAARLSAVSGRDIRVELVRSGSAQLGSDFTLSSEAIVIPAGKQSGSPLLRIVDDAQVELPETVTFTMGSATNVTPTDPREFTVTIIDDDSPVPLP